MDKISKPFIKKNRKSFIVFDFEEEKEQEQKWWQKIAKFYDVIGYLCLFIVFYGAMYVNIIILPISCGVVILGLIFFRKTIFAPKKYGLKTIEISHQRIRFNYDNEYIDYIFSDSAKDEICLIVHSEKDKLALEYEGHILNFKNGEDLTIFLDHLASRLRLEFDKSVETGVNQEVLHYKAIPPNSKKHQN